MPRFYSLQTPGAPTFTAKSASLNLSGRDEFALSIDPDVMDREWYHSQDYYPHNPLHGHSPLSPADDVLTTVGFSYPSHTVPASDALAGMSLPSLYRRRLLLFFALLSPNATLGQWPKYVSHVSVLPHSIRVVLGAADSRALRADERANERVEPAMACSPSTMTTTIPNRDGYT